jgi:hypothetical protein
MSTETENNNVFDIKAYTKKELRLLYGIPEASFRRWLKALPETNNTGQKNWLTAIQVEAIIKAYGVPGKKQFIQVIF